MPSLQIRDLPESLHARLRQRAEDERRSLAQEAVVALEQGLNEERGARPSRRRAILAAAVERPVALPGGTPDPAALVRKDRAR